MSILTVNNLSHSYGSREILKNVNFRLLNGEHVGLIGANGEGKSSFLNIITGKLQPDHGSIEWAKRVRVGYLDQHSRLSKEKTIENVLQEAFQYLFDMEAEIGELYMKMADADENAQVALMEEAGDLQERLDHSDFYLIDSKINDIARGLGLLDLGLDRPVTDLSGGQRTKVLLAKLLLQKPDILLLDEPTNYLDEEHIDWLKNYLIHYENAFILISHDISFLNEVINLIYHVEGQDLSRYVGTYEDFERIYEAQKAQKLAAYKKQQQEIAELEDFVQRNKARVATRNMAMSRQKMLDKMDLIELEREKPKARFAFQEAKTPGKELFRTKDLVIGYGDPLTHPIDLTMIRGERLALTGANGLGKSTLLKSILGLIPAVSGSVELGYGLSIGYFEQELIEVGDRNCIEEIWETFPGWTQFEARSALASCGLTTKHIESKVRVLSGGEQAKLRLCKLINQPSNLLILDEPTNHLDPESKEELKRALKAYKGSILLISHEREFYEELVTRVLDCEAWSCKL